MAITNNLPCVSSVVGHYCLVLWLSPAPLISLRCRFSGDTLSVEACLLLVETYLATYNLERASSRIEYLEGKLFGGTLGGNGRGEGEGEGDLASSENDQYRPRIHLFKARLLLQHRNMKACKKELKNFTSASGTVSWSS